MIGLEVLAATVYFAALTKLNSARMPGKLLGLAGVLVLVFYISLGYWTEFQETADPFFEGWYQAFGIVGGSLLSLTLPWTRALTVQGARFRATFEHRREELLRDYGGSERALDVLPELVVFGLDRTIARKLPANTRCPDWYEPPDGDTRRPEGWDVRGFFADVDNVTSVIGSLCLRKQGERYGA